MTLYVHTICAGSQLREVRTAADTEGGGDGVAPTPYLEILRGRDGRDGLAGLGGRDGKDGEQGERGEKGDRGVQGLPGPQGEAGRSGVVYTRWGRTTCPSGQGTVLVYNGIVGGSKWSSKGGGANYLCMPDNPQYSTINEPGVNGHTSLYGTEYGYGRTSPLYATMNHHNVPCAVCLIQERGNVLMIPARNVCPTSWTKEYDGVLMSSHNGHYRSMFECVDREAESVPGSAANMDGAFFMKVEATCNGLPCPPYDPQKELLCVVCTK